MSGLRRDRLTGPLSRLHEPRIGLVVAPAGSGKTTLLAQVAAETAGPVAWYWAEAADAEPGAFISRLEESFREAMPALPRTWERAEDVGLALETWAGRAPLLAIDDFHVLQGSDADKTVERLALCAPTLRILISSRTLPNFNLSRLRVSDAVRVLGADELRFRSWEVERLFRDFYGEPLPPDDVALLSRRTEGWAAALQLFHLATRGKDPVHRRRTLATLSSRSTLVREYLARNVIDELPGHLRDFMIETCVLERLSGPLCDEFLQRDGSARVLAEIERRQLFTYLTGDEGEYRYHEVLRSYLDAVLVEEVGETEAQLRYRRAGRLMLRVGALPEAMRALCRAADSAGVRRLLGRDGRELVDGSRTWIDTVPHGISRADPWFLLAQARQYRAAGQFHQAVAAYRDAERAFAPAPASAVCRAEARELKAWLDSETTHCSGWSGVVRHATMREPLASSLSARARELPAAEHAFACGLAALLAGHVVDAVALLRDAMDEPTASPTLVTSAHLAVGIARLLSGDRDGVSDVECASEDAERLGQLWLARMGRAALALSDRPDGRSESGSARLAFERNDDRWGVALTSLMEGWGALANGSVAISRLESAVDATSRLDAEVLETWARAALSLALARARDERAGPLAVRAAADARSLGVPGAAVLAYAGLERVDSRRAREYRALGRNLNDECVLSIPSEGRPSGSTPGTGVPNGEQPSVAVRCFGGLSITIGDAPLDLSSVKPRVRRLVRMLALHAGRPVHREALAEALWPEAPPQAATRNLQVAVSSVRQLLEPGVGRGASSLIVRDCEAYCLSLPADAWVDHVEFDRALAMARAAHTRGDREQELSAHRSALDLYRDELLPEEGPAEWLLPERDRRADEACDTAFALGKLLLVECEPRAAAAAFARGLRIDRYRDELWRLRISSLERAGDFAAARHVRREYGHVLNELGLSLGG